MLWEWDYPLQVNHIRNAMDESRETGENVLCCLIPRKYFVKLCRCCWFAPNTPGLIKRCNGEPRSSPTLHQLPTEIFSISSVSFSRPRRGLETNFINWYLQLSVHQTMDFILPAKHTHNLLGHLQLQKLDDFKLLRQQSSYNRDFLMDYYKMQREEGGAQEGFTWGTWRRTSYNPTLYVYFVCKQQVC